MIAVCGTHGKSSTTAMVAKVFIDAGKDPSVIVGTKMTELGGRNWRKGASDVFIVEACEYRRSFHYISPDIVLMTSVDGDHFDAFTSIEDYHEAFVTFLKRLPQEGVVITHGRNSDCLHVATKSGKTVIDADVHAAPSVGVPGAHMRQNAQLVRALADHLKISHDAVLRSLKDFHGTWRRMEVKGELDGGITVIDDYGHHPVEIRATLQAMKEGYPNKRIICVFQPHTHDRTIKLYNEFTHAFSDADIVIIPDIYNARSEIETDTVDLAAFSRDIAEKSETDCRDGGGCTNTLSLLHERMQPGDVIIVMGAGSITKLADDLLAGAAH